MQLVQVCSYFGAIYSYNVCHSWKLFKVIKVIDVDIIQMLVTSACYDKQHVCAYLQLVSC